MPRGNRRGPEGFGPMTGRGMGYCGEMNTTAYVKDSNRLLKGRLGCKGSIGGRRHRRFPAELGHCRRQGLYNETLTKEEVKKLLEEEIILLKDEIKNIENRIKELDKE